MTPTKVTRSDLVDVVDAIRDVFEALHESVEPLHPDLLKHLLRPLGSFPCAFKLLRRLHEALLHSVQSTTGTAMKRC